MSNFTKKYETPEQLRQAIEDRMRSIAKESGIDTQRLIRHVAFERFLSRLFSINPVPCILKGGYALELLMGRYQAEVEGGVSLGLRLKPSRTTKDIDFALAEDETPANLDKIAVIIRSIVAQATQMDTKDFFSFKVEKERPIKGLPAGLGFTVHANLGSRLFSSFRIEIGAGDVEIPGNEKLKPLDLLSFAGINCPSVFLTISREQHFAEKFHAYAKPYDNEKRRSRVKDLIDMALLVKIGINEMKLAWALASTFKKRNTHHLPLKFPSPPADWQEKFKTLAMECQLDMSIEQVVEILGNLYCRLPISINGVFMHKVDQTTPSEDTIQKNFGYYPHWLALEAKVERGTICIYTLPNLKEKISDVKNSAVVQGWVYPPLDRYLDFTSGKTLSYPYPARVFGLPKTHIIECTGKTDEGYVEFLIWALSFFLGIRLTTTEAGFVDATPIDSGKLVDFRFNLTPPYQILQKLLTIADQFWQANGQEVCRMFNSAVHTLFISHTPRYFPFESFIYAYISLDTCYAIAKKIDRTQKTIHQLRISHMCEQLGTQCPAWHEEVAKNLRNPTLHEGLFANAPLGFAHSKMVPVTGVEHEMRKLACRWLVSLLGVKSKQYIESPVTHRQTQVLRLDR